MRMLRFIGVLLLLVAVCVVVVLVMGSRLPREHRASASAVIAAPQARVWQIIEDINAQPSWRPGLIAVEALPADNGHRCWTEVQKHMRMPLCEVLAAAPTTRIVHIADPNLAFGGDWVYELQPIDANSTRLTITENGTTGPVIWRFAGHYIFHEDTTIKQYESALQQAAAKS